VLHLRQHTRHQTHVVVEGFAIIHAPFSPLTRHQAAHKLGKPLPGPKRQMRVANVGVCELQPKSICAAMKRASRLHLVVAGYKVRYGVAKDNYTAYIQWPGVDLLRLEKIPHLRPRGGRWVDADHPPGLLV